MIVLLYAQGDYIELAPHTMIKQYFVLCKEAVCGWVGGQIILLNNKVQLAACWWWCVCVCAQKDTGSTQRTQREGEREPEPCCMHIIGFVCGFEGKQVNNGGGKMSCSFATERDEG